MRLWPFANNKKAVASHEYKSASFIYGMGALRVMSSNYEAFASEGYGLNPVVKACIDKIADAVISVDLTAYKKNKDGSIGLVGSHPYLDLMLKPNPMQSGDDFLGAMIRYYLIAGNAYAHGVGIDPFVSRPKPPLELYLLKPNCVKVDRGDGVFPKQYEYRANNKLTVYPVNQLNGLSSVLHKRTFNPIDDWRGLSPMTAAAYGVDVLNEGQRWNLRLLQNEGRPSGALIVQGGDGKPLTLSEEQYQRMREQIEQQFTGSANAGRPLLLEGGLDWKEMSMNAKDMDHERNMNKAARDIALVYGVPPMLLGIPGDNTYSNMAEARLAFWTDTVLPLLRSFLASFNGWLSPMYGDGVELWFDEDTIPALEPLRKSKADRIEASNSMKINEKRVAMGLGELPEGDVLLVDSNKIPLDLVGDMGLSEVTAITDKPLQATAITDKPALGASNTISEVALNGAQMSALQQIVQAVADGLLPSATAIQLIMISIPTITQDEAERLVNPSASFEQRPQGDVVA